MKLSFSTLGCPEWSWSEILSAASDLGYQGIEVRGIGREIFAPRAKEFLPGLIGEAAEALSSRSLEMPCLTTACMFALPERELEYLLECRAYMALAATIGAKYLRVMGDITLDPDAPLNEAQMKKVLGILAPEAEALGVTLLVETNGYYSKTARLRALLDELGSPAVAALWDVHHPYRFCGEDAEMTYNNLGNYIKHVHIKDSVMQDGKVRYRSVGNGDIPIKDFVRVLNEGGYDGFYSLEWLRRWDLSLEEAGIVFAQFVPYMRRLG